MGARAHLLRSFSCGPPVHRRCPASLRRPGYPRLASTGASDTQRPGCRTFDLGSLVPDHSHQLRTEPRGMALVCREPWPGEAAEQDARSGSIGCGLARAMGQFLIHFHITASVRIRTRRLAELCSAMLTKRSLVSLLGAVVMVLSLAITTFMQQLIVFRDIAISETNSSLQPGNIQRSEYYNDFTGSPSEGLLTPSLNMTAAIYRSGTPLTSVVATSSDLQNTSQWTLRLSNISSPG